MGMYFFMLGVRKVFLYNFFEGNSDPFCWEIWPSFIPIVLRFVFSISWKFWFRVFFVFIFPFFISISSILSSMPETLYYFYWVLDAYIYESWSHSKVFKLLGCLSLFFLNISVSIILSWTSKIPSHVWWCFLVFLKEIYMCTL